MLIAVSENINKIALFTPWTIIHIYSSMIGYFILNLYTDNIIYKIIIISILHFLYECKDYYFAYIKKYKKNDKSYKGSLLNSVGDTIGSFIGIYIAIKINSYKNNNTHFYIITNSLIAILITTIYTLFDMG